MVCILSRVLLTVVSHTPAGQALSSHARLSRLRFAR